MLDVLPAGRAAGVPHGDVFAATAFDVVTDDARSQQAAAGAAAGGGDHFAGVVEHVRPAGRGMSRLAALNRFALQHIAGVGGECVRNVDDHLPLAMRAEALLASVFVFDLKDVPIRAFDANSHVRPASEPLRRKDRSNRRTRRSGAPSSGKRLRKIVCLSSEPDS